MDWKRAERLLRADVGDLARRASDPEAALRALVAKVDDAIAAAEAHLEATRAKLDTLPVALDEQRKLLAKLDAVIAKAEADGRADLHAAAVKRRAKHAAEAAAVEAELAGVDAELARTESTLTRLRARRAEVAAALEEARLSAPSEPAAPEDDPGEELGFDIASLDGLGTAPPGDPAARRGPPEPAAQGEQGGGGGGDDLDAEFAALLANMGEDLEVGGGAAADDDGSEGVDDILAGLPDLVEVAEGELPEGADPDSDAPIDFSSLDDLPAVRAAAAKAGGGAAVADKGGGDPARLPAKASAKPPAKAGAGVEGEARAGGGSKRAVWIVTGVVVAAGGAVAALFAFGVL